MILYGSITGVSEIFGAFGWREKVEDFSHPFPGLLDGSGLCPSDMAFELGEELFDWIEIRAVRRQEEQVSAGLADGASRRLTFMATEIVEDHDVAVGEGRDEDLVHIKGEEFAIHGSIDDPGSNAIDA